MGYGNGGSYGPVTQPTTNPQGQREPVVLREVTRLDSHIEGLHAAISELETRLSGVLMPEPPSTQKTPGDLAPHSGVPLGATVASAADRVQSACGRVVALIARLEV